MSSSGLSVPVAYQGGKHRLAGSIVDIIKPGSEPFWDLCCGSGAVSIEVINRGKPVSEVFMLDKAEWGAFWRSVGKGTFDLAQFEEVILSIPEDKNEIQGHLKGLACLPSTHLTSYIYLVLQAGSFGGKAIWSSNNTWRNTSFRSYWLPTKTSSRRYPVNPMMPMPTELLRRVRLIVERLRGVVGFYDDIREAVIPPNSLVYIDPPYAGTTSYGHDFDLTNYIRSYLPKKCDVWISESMPLSKEAILLSTGRHKGGISGTRTKPNEEWISYIRT